MKQLKPSKNGKIEKIEKIEKYMTEIACNINRHHIYERWNFVGTAESLTLCSLHCKPPLKLEYLFWD